MGKILTSEPDRGSQICGYQIAHGMPWNEYCAEPKAPGKYFCAEHDRIVLQEDGPIRPYNTTKGH